MLYPLSYGRSEAPRVYGIAAARPKRPGPGMRQPACSRGADGLSAEAEGFEPSMGVKPKPH